MAGSLPRGMNIVSFFFITSWHPAPAVPFALFTDLYFSQPESRLTYTDSLPVRSFLSISKGSLEMRRDQSGDTVGSAVAVDRRWLHWYLGSYMVSRVEEHLQAQTCSSSFSTSSFSPALMVSRSLASTPMLQATSATLDSRSPCGN